MDRPLGPRQPDKRYAAYESIFGRPSATHHQPAMSQPSFPLQQQFPQHPMYHYQSGYSHSPDRRTSFGSTYAHSTYSHSSYGPPNNYPSPLQRHNPYNHQSQHVSPQSLYPPASIHSRARSIASSNQSPGIIMPQPPEPPDHSLEPLTRQGLTPAQAYQAQFYLNDTAGSQQQSGYRQSPALSENTYHYPSSDVAATRQDLPKLSLTLEQDDSRLGLDFAATNGAGSDQGTDEDSSELPWARRDDSASMMAGSPQRPSPANPLLVDTTALRNSASSNSPSSSSFADHSNTYIDPNSSVLSRKSSDSARTVPRFPEPRRQRSMQDRSMSMSAASTILDSRRAARISSSAFQGGRDSPTSTLIKPRKTPIVYPALLSRVAEAFRERIALSDRVKDGLTYKNAFDGRDAVDKIAYIIKTTDRNLALLLGRALDAQKIFHDVTYDHRLRDSPNELYQFRTRLPSPFVSGDVTGLEGSSMMVKDRPSSAPVQLDSYNEDGEDVIARLIHQPQHRRDSISSDDFPLPTGVFTLLTDCYSPTCSRDQLCYSIACPRRLEQQARLNMKPQPGLSKQLSRESIADAGNANVSLWAESVPPEIVNSVSETEKKRQEAINEVIYTERDFVRDLEYLRDFWVIPLKEKDIIPKERRLKFVNDVFWNYHEIIATNLKLRDALVKRQKSYAVVEKIGDVFLEAVQTFSPFVTYGANQIFGKFEFEKEKSVNPAFTQFVEVTERLTESRKLELNAYLTRPTARLARYPLLLGAILKYTPKDSPDKTLIPQVVDALKELLTKVNTESGKSDNRFQLAQLTEQLYYKPGDEVDLRLMEDGREIVYKGLLSKRDGDLQVYLFDHAILFTKPSKNKQSEQYRVYRKPIPLELLCISASDDASENGRRNRQLVKRNSFNRDSRGLPLPPVAIRTEGKGQHWINFVHLGRKYYQLMLWASSALSQKKWLENIYKQQQIMRERSLVFVTVALSEGFFVGPNKVNCAAPFSGGRRIAYGTNDGIYVSDLREPSREPVKVLTLLEVTQIDILEDYQLLIALSERQVITFPLEALDPIDPMAGLKRAKRISSHTSFFKAGHCLGKVLVCIVKSSQLSSTFKTLEPIDQNVRGRSKPTFRKLLQGGNDTLKLFREFYIPVESTSIHFLKTKLCVGCTRGFEIVDLETLDTQGLLDPNDETLEFVRRRENLRPMAIYRVQNEFLLCYDEFAFYVNKSGRRTRREFMVYWEGMPTGFALREPFVLAFEPTFVEIRDINTGSLVQVIQGSNLRLLFADAPLAVSHGGNVGPGNNGYHGGYEYSGYQPAVGFNGPNSYGGYGSPMQYAQGYVRQGREEILVVSDDRVLALRVKE